MESLPNTAARAVAPTAAIALPGKDSLDLLHRISTQFLSDLEPGQGRATMFCEFRGRLLHRAWVQRDASGMVWLLRDDAPASELMAFLDRSIFREDVRLEDRTGDANAPLLPLGETFVDDLARIRAGHARHGHEIAEEFTPFEIGRAHEVHLSKGCFTGQEALMRLVTYKSVRRRLVLVEGSGPPPAVPYDARRDDAKLGRITSAHALPASGAEARWLGLAVLGRDVGTPVPALAIGDLSTLERAEAFAETRALGLPEQGADLG